MAAKNSANQKKKNTTEKNRKNSIQKNHHASFLMMPEAQVLLANGKKVELLQQSKIVKDGLSKIPSNMLEYYTGGTSWAKDPADRLTEFIQWRRQEAKKLNMWCDEKEELLKQQQGTNQPSAPPELAVNISDDASELPVSDDNEIDISEISDDIEAIFQGLTREDVVEQTKSNLIKPEDCIAAYSSPCPSPSFMPISWPKQCPMFLHSKITSYVTIHSVDDMSILWVDERITHVNLWKPEDVFGQSPYLHMDPQDRPHAEAVRDATLAMGQNGMVSYAFNKKGGGTIYQRSQSWGTKVTLYLTTNQPIQGFLLFTAEMSEAEYSDGMRAEKELLSGQSPPCISDETYSNPGASRVNEQSVAGCGDVIDGYRDINIHPGEVQCYDEPSPLPSVCDSLISQTEMESSDNSFSNSQSPQYHELNVVSQVQCYDNQPQFAPTFSVCDSSISQSMEIDSSDSSFDNSQSSSLLSFNSEYSLNYASPDIYMSP